MLNLMKNHVGTNFLRIVGISFQIALILFSFVTAYGQNEDYYTITGRVVNENGKPNSDAGVWVEPVVYNSKQFDRFIEGVGTDIEGRFTKKIVKNKFTSNRDYFLFVTVDTNLDALTTVAPPFVRVREHDKTYDGKFIKLGNKDLIDVGDVKVQFWYGQANLNFADYFKKKNINPSERGWRGLYIQVRNAKGYLVYASTLSISDIQKYVDQANSKVKISLPEGKWKIEILEEYPAPKIAESSYFVIKKDEQPKDITIAPVRKLK